MENKSEMNKLFEYFNKKFKIEFLFLMGIVFFLIVFPLFATQYLLHIAILIFLYGYLGQAWNILGGYAGQFSFGHATFFGIGAYVSTILFMEFGLTPWVGMIIGGSIALIMGLFCGFLTFRYGLRGPYFALSMLGFAEILRIIALNWDFCKGALGILIPIKGHSFYYFQFSRRNEYYYIIFIMMIGVLYITHRIEKSKLGDYLVSIREDESTSESIGIDTFKYKLIAVAISAFLTSLGGSFYAQYLSYIEPNLNFGVQVSVECFIRPIFGGMGTVWGPIIGAFILGPLAEIVRIFLGGYSGIHLALYGVIIMVVTAYMPNGLFGFLQTKRFMKLKSQKNEPSLKPLS